MKTPRRPARPRKALLPSGEKLHIRLALIEEAQGRTRKTFIFMPTSRESKPAAFPEGEGPQRGDLVIAFEPLHATEEEAALGIEQFRERYCQKRDLAPVELPWKRDLGKADPPPRSDPDPELEQLAEDRKTPEVRPLTDAEVRDVASGLLKTGNLFSRSAARSALAGGEVPLGADESFPRAEFASSSAGTLLIRIWTHAGEVAKPREANRDDRQKWPTAFRRFLAQCSPTFNTTTEDDN